MEVLSSRNKLNRLLVVGFRESNKSEIYDTMEIVNEKLIPSSFAFFFFLLFKKLVELFYFLIKLESSQDAGLVLSNLERERDNKIRL